MIDYNTTGPQLTISGTKLQIAATLALLDELAPGFIDRRADNPRMRVCDTCPASSCMLVCVIQPREYADIKGYVERHSDRKLPHPDELYPARNLDADALRVLRSQSGFSVVKRNRRGIKPS